MPYRPTRAEMSDPWKMRASLARLVAISVQQRRAGLVPALSSTHVRYVREPPGQEEWLTAVETWRRGYGDCEDLAIWRTADLICAGEQANVVIKLVAPGKSHAQVLSGGVLRDPSRVRGMRGSS